MLILSGLFAVGMFFGFDYVNVFAAEDGSEEISTEADESVHPSEGISGEASSDAALESKSSYDATIESESTSYSAEELESLIDRRKLIKRKLKPVLMLSMNQNLSLNQHLPHPVAALLLFRSRMIPRCVPLLMNLSRDVIL